MVKIRSKIEGFGNKPPKKKTYKEWEKIAKSKKIPPIGAFVVRDNETGLLGERKIGSNVIKLSSGIEELEEPLKVPEPAPQAPIEPVEKTKTSNLEDDLGTQLSKAQKTDLTDGGQTTLHTPAAHKTSHQNGGADEISVAGLSGELTDDQPPKSHALSSHSVPTGDVSLNYNKLTLLDDPTSDYDAAHKKYVDDIVDFSPLVAGDLLVASADTEAYWQTSTYTKKKDISIGERGGTFRIKWDMKANVVTNVGRGRLYKNGVYIDIEESTSLTTYTTYSHDVALAAFDEIQLYLNASGDDPQCTIVNFRIYRNIFDYVINLN